MRLNTEEMTLEQARAIVDADNKRETDRRKALQVEEARSFLGRFFKYHQREIDRDAILTDSPIRDHRWWLYATPTGVDGWGHLSFRSFGQRADIVQASR